MLTKKDIDSHGGHIRLILGLKIDGNYYLGLRVQALGCGSMEDYPYHVFLTLQTSRVVPKYPVEFK